MQNELNKKKHKNM